ncbi:ThiF family adenylyltransferase [Mesorhizobium sp. MSK_1335]|uniref:ThiF family adenylyltransferase n=1 Tax=Mesorhizobium montanum TaxID=3072323 RepID=A0ABU4ZXA3_9HYPH|nr:ThiF family adenylyltransferase [Mesorhizobium sp. MSK_1335]MDX8529062.1 ThiF family adenylyltransferase [Mesorhizobium sp. MSK_1335]
MIPYVDLKSPEVPKWEENPVNRNRMRAELDHLSHFAGSTLLVDEIALADGVLHVEFRWPLPDGRLIDLEAIYPDSFPRLRPHVMLRCDPEQYPSRHCAPDGSLCLLGRDSGLWQSRMTLADILYSNLAKALDASKDEDPQGEPAEVWWNETADRSSGNYVLVDSSWNLSGFDQGKVEIEFVVDWGKDRPAIQAAVSKVWSDTGELLADRSFPLPITLGRRRDTAVFPWKRDDHLPMPVHQELPSLLKRLGHGSRYAKTSGGDIRISATLKRSELQFQTYGDAWVFVLHYSKNIPRITRNGAQKTKEVGFVVPTYRAGIGDIGSRVPSVGALRDKTIAIVGLGALGSPLAAELAKNGCRKLIVLDCDYVEPGNSIRWAAGASAWGRQKTEFIKEHTELEYPWTTVEPISHRIGSASSGTDGAGDHQLLIGLMDEADLVIDAAASTGVSFFLADCCRALHVPMICVYASTTLKGGIVAFHHPESGCPVCKEIAYAAGTIDRPPGMGDSQGLIQPPGCSEPTFTGASFDLQELTLEAVRMAVDVLSRPQDFEVSLVHTLALHDGLKRIPPAWNVDELQPSPACGCLT